jgi:hypothetical protein
MTGCAVSGVKRSHNHLKPLEDKHLRRRKEVSAHTGNLACKPCLPKHAIAIITGLLSIVTCQANISVPQ